VRSPLDDLRVVVIGAGPVGLAAAAHLAERRIAFTVLEAGERPAAAVRRWGHVRLFSPWRFNIDAAGDRASARTVRLDLPQTGVCDSNPVAGGCRG
jgi:glycine/D-amino acid oxidase-like deaminating enzyme